MSSPAPTRSVRFELLADAEPGMLPRLLAPFARRDLTPDRVRSSRFGDTLQVVLDLEAMPGECLTPVEGNLRQVIGVRGVTTVLLRPMLVAVPG